MEEIVQRYKDEITSKHCKLDCEYKNDNEILIWGLCWDDEQDDDDDQPTPHLPIGIARILREDGKYFVAWNPTPRQERTFMTKEDAEVTFTSFDDLYTALDEEIAKHC